MSAPTTGGLVGTNPCPHPHCPTPIRIVYNRRQNALKAYHGEDLLAEMRLDANDGKALHTLLHEAASDGGEEYRRVVLAMGLTAAFAIAELHVRRGD